MVRILLPFTMEPRNGMDNDFISIYQFNSSVIIDQENFQPEMMMITNINSTHLAELTLHHSSEQTPWSLVFDVVRSLCIFITLCSACFSIIYVIRSQCRSSSVFLVILISGLLLEIFCILDVPLPNIPVITDFKINMNSCQYYDMHLTSTLGCAFALFALTLSVMRANIGNRGIHSYCKNVVTFIFLSGCALLYRVTRITKNETKQAPIFISNNAAFYSSLCQEKPNVTIFTMEMIFLWLPLITMFLQCALSCDSNRHEEFRILPRCNTNGDGNCRLCSGLNSTLMVAVVCVWIFLLITRPIAFVYHLARDTLMRDFITPFCVQLLHIVVILQCFTNMCTKKKTDKCLPNNRQLLMYKTELAIIV